ncbi:unnamed protein product [Timema podura]|uniref:Peptidase M12B domain-containing protein n=1 Tax=Timema podura TaxID=61482 RepID=A0ABN7NMJ5_TIMPD|nr:unnamed protein product [Timema podura]
MLLTADSSFYHELCGSSVNVAVREMLSFLAEVNLMFQNTDFDENLIPDNIGLKVKEIRIFTTPVFPFEYSFHSKNYLELFSVMSHSKLCLSLAFTYRTFIDSVLGISWIANPREDPRGGICAGKYSRRGWLNTLAVNMKTISGNAVSHQKAALNVAHEIGHSFGSLHDNVSCSGNSLHTMAPISPQKASFSVCSRRRMLQVMRSNGGCLTKKYSFSFCGNVHCSRIALGNFRAGVVRCRVKSAGERGVCLGHRVAAALAATALLFSEQSSRSRKSPRKLPQLTMPAPPAIRRLTHKPLFQEKADNSLWAPHHQRALVVIH